VARALAALKAPGCCTPEGAELERRGLARLVPLFWGKAPPGQ
jgi:hypothetical protein